VSYFVKHSPCPKCGSRDNLATYSDGGGHCFGCGYHPKPSISPYVLKEQNGTENQRVSMVGPTLPEDGGVQYSTTVVEWARSYGIDVEELLGRSVSYSPKESRLIFNFYSDDGTRILSQARNFSPMAKSKYFTYGKPEEVVPIYYATTNTTLRATTLVVCEDCLSAIKVARQFDCMPVLSSDLSLTKLKRMSRFYNNFVVWLDGDMYHKAQRICRRLQLLGCEAKAVYTPLDPKCYDNETIRNVVLQGKL
jgi:hypothetical protein